MAPHLHTAQLNKGALSRDEKSKFKKSIGPSSGTSKMVWFLVAQGASKLPKVKVFCPKQ